MTKKLIIFPNLLVLGFNQLGKYKKISMSFNKIAIQILKIIIKKEIAERFITDKSLNKFKGYVSKPSTFPYKRDKSKLPTKLLALSPVFFEVIT